MNIQSSILTGVWHIDGNYVDAHMLNLIRLMTGESNLFTQKSEAIPVMLVDVANNVEVEMNDGRRAGNTTEKYVAIFNVTGVITKYDQYCGPSGMMTLHKAINQAANDTNIIGGVMVMDSPGGQADYMQTVSEAWRNFSKPKNTWFTGLCASAGYYLASGSDAIYANEKTDLVGSIGTKMLITDYKEQLEKNGIKVHEIFAEQSTEKGSLIAEALKGNYQPLQETIISPLAEQFISFVQSNRTISDDAAYKGKIYNAKKAKSIGMIDGFKSLDAVIQLTYKAGMKQHKQSNRNSLNTNNMNVFQKVAAKLGFDSIEAKDGYISINAEQAEKLMANDNADYNAVVAKNKDLEAKLTALTDKVEANEAAIKLNGENIKAFGDDTTEEQTTGTADADPANDNVETDGDNKPKAKTEKEKYGHIMSKYLPDELM